jgi:hypothetical protein
MPHSGWSFAMGLPFGPLFLICLLFADLTDDVIALVLPTMPVSPPLSATDQPTLLSSEFRQQCDEEIRLSPMAESSFSARDMCCFLPSMDWILGSRFPGLRFDANRLYVLMSLQR